MPINRWIFAALTLAGCALAAAQSQSATTTLIGDRWNYPFNFSPGSRPTASLFNSDLEGYGFNKRDGEAVLQFGAALPFGAATSFTVTAARVEVWGVANSAWDPTTATLELYAAGFDDTYKELAGDYTTGTVWTESSPYVGGGAGASSHRTRDPYPRDYADDSHAEDNLAATPWSKGVHPDYVSTGNTVDPYKVTFTLDVMDPRVQAELQADLLRGVSTWVVCSTYLSSGQGDSAYPGIYLRGSSTPPGSAAVPMLFIEVQPNSGVGDWQMY